MSLSLPTRPAGSEIAVPDPDPEPLTEQPSRSTVQPVFVDATGRRLRLLRRVGAVVGLACVGYLVVLAAAVGGGIVDPVTSGLPLSDAVAPLVADPATSTTTTTGRATTRSTATTRATSTARTPSTAAPVAVPATSASATPAGPAVPAVPAVPPATAAPPTSAPATTTAAPATTTAAPAVTTDAPATTTQAPATTADAPATDDTVVADALGDAAPGDSGNGTS